jgi:formylglycine-generating enzyme required for sulfatase activity
LFADVCLAVHHAHQKGVIHRDLKPGNILVTTVGKRHTPKLIDFGIAHAAEGASGAPNTPEAGIALGTPAYMAPEQLTGDIKRIDTRTDVYALGVILRELLTGSVPRSKEWDAVGRRDRQTPGYELKWIVDRAMATSPDDRYPSAAEFAADLHRFLHQEPVLAGPSSTRYRFRKFVRRNRLAVFALVAVTGTSFAGMWASWLSAMEAERHRKEALAANGRLQARNDEFELLAITAQVRAAQSAWTDARSSWPQDSAALGAWLFGRGEPLALAAPRIAQALKSLRQRAQPLSAAERDTAFTNSSDAGRANRIESLIQRWERATEVARGLRQVAVPALSPVQAKWNARRLAAHVLTRIGMLEESEGFGQEEETLALALAALARVDGGDTSLPRYLALHRVTVAWLTVGDIDRALAIGREFAAAVPPGHGDVDPLLRDIVRIGGELRSEAGERWVAEQRVEIANLRAGIEARMPRQFTNGADQVLYESLLRAESELEQILDEKVSEARELVGWASRVEGWTRGHPEAPSTWEAAAAAIRRADGIVASRLYQATPIDLLPQTGLVPIGMNPATGLWEFYDLRSAYAPGSDLDSVTRLPIPRHDTTGHIRVGPDTGIVFVLVPGGRFQMGAAIAESADQYDAAAASDERPIHDVELAPFFLARHELSQGQFWRLQKKGRPSRFAAGMVLPGHGVIHASNPVENLAWTLADRTLRDQGMTLPTEAQWEYACRAGTRTPWWTGADERSLEGAANLFDLTAKEAGLSSKRAPIGWLKDGMSVHGPVDSMRSNPWGLHHVHGNVAEMTLDRLGPYDNPLRPGDGLRKVGTADQKTMSDGDLRRMVRGGGFADLMGEARSSSRLSIRNDETVFYIGLRAARALRR